MVTTYLYANLSENDTLPWHRHRTITSVHSAHGLLSHEPPPPILLSHSQATGCRDTETAQTEPPRGWHSTQMVAALSVLVFFSSWRAEAAWQQKAERWRAGGEGTFPILATAEELGRENTSNLVPEVLGAGAS